MTDISFALDVGEKHTRIVDLTMKNGKINLLSIGSANTVANFFTDDSEKSLEIQAEVVSKLCNDLKITKKNVNIIMPDSQSFFQIMEFAKLNEKELLSAVRYQSDQFIPMPIEEVVLDLEIIEENKATNKNKILIVASPKKTVDRLEKLAEMMGLVPSSLENDLSASGRFISEVMKPKGTGSFLVINIGYSTTSIYLIDYQTLIVLQTRTLKLGYELFLKELRFNLELPETKAIDVLRTIGFVKNASYDVSTIVAPTIQELTNEIGKFFVQAKDKYQQPVSKMYLYNYAASILALDKKIQEGTGMAVENMFLRDLIVNNPVSQSFANNIPEYVSAIGASIR